jgi:hypothetical protein
VIKDIEFEVLKEVIALKVEAARLQFRSFADSLEREEAQEQLMSAAESLGYKIGRQGMSLPTILSDDTVVGGAAEYGHHQGAEILERSRFEAQYCSERSWKALSAEEQAEYREEFHSLCACGIGENCRFYNVLMAHYLRGMIEEERGRCGVGRPEIVTYSEFEIDRARPARER